MAFADPEAPELPGDWVAPGLVDAHAHLSMDMEGACGLPRGSAELVSANLRAQERAGVLAIRDAGAVPGAAAVDAQPGARVLRSGGLMAPPGRYFAGLLHAVAPADLVAAAVALVATGAPWVKVIADFPGEDMNFLAPRVNYEPALLAELAGAVHAAGARLAAHVSGPVGPYVAAGVDSIEHGPGTTSDDVGRMAERGTAWTPTLTTVADHLERMTEGRGPPADAARRALARLHETLPLAASLGVPVLTGTDEHAHGSLADEVARLREFDLPPAVALASATTTARAYLGLAGLEPGAPADLVTYDADPRSDASALARPAAVVLGGRRIR